jgi:hypothetical protein
MDEWEELERRMEEPAPGAPEPGKDAAKEEGSEGERERKDRKDRKEKKRDKRSRSRSKSRKTSRSRSRDRRRGRVQTSRSRSRERRSGRTGAVEDRNGDARRSTGHDDRDSGRLGGRYEPPARRGGYGGGGYDRYDRRERTPPEVRLEREREKVGQGGRSEPHGVATATTWAHAMMGPMRGPPPLPLLAPSSRAGPSSCRGPAPPPIRRS